MVIHLSVDHVVRSLIKKTDRLLNKQKFYSKENHDQIIEYQKHYYLDICDQKVETHKFCKKQNREKINI